MKEINYFQTFCLVWIFSKFVCSWLQVMQRFYSKPTKIGDIICFPSTGGASHGVGSTPTEVAPSPNHAQDCGRLLLNRADIDRHRFLSLFRVGGVLSRIDTNDHTVDTVLTSDESLWVKAGPRPVSQRRDRQQEREEDSKSEVGKRQKIPFSLPHPSSTQPLCWRKSWVQGRPPAAEGRAVQRFGQTLRGVGIEKSLEDCSTGRKIQVREPHQPCQGVEFSARPHLLECLPVLVSWQAGFFWFVSQAKLCLQIEDKNENIGRGLHMQWDCFLSAKAAQPVTKQVFFHLYKQQNI